MKKILIPVLALFVLANSCKKKTTEEPVAEEKYMSLTAASTWNYTQLNNLTGIGTFYTLTSTNRDSTANGRSYHVFTNSSAANEYYAISGTDYFTFRTLGANFGGTSNEIAYLKTGVAIGASWTQTVPVTVAGIPLSVTLTNTYTSKETQKVVLGKIYYNVIHVTTTMSIPGATVVTDIHSYYAPKVGLISNTNKITISAVGFPTQTTDQTTNLITSDIK
jgi:hypothetical protein